MALGGLHGVTLAENEGINMIFTAKLYCAIFKQDVANGDCNMVAIMKAFSELKSEEKKLLIAYFRDNKSENEIKSGGVKKYGTKFKDNKAVISEIKAVIEKLRNSSFSKYYSVSSLLNNLERDELRAELAENKIIEMEKEMGSIRGYVEDILDKKVKNGDKGDISKISELELYSEDTVRILNREGLITLYDVVNKGYKAFPFMRTININDIIVAMYRRGYRKWALSSADDIGVTVSSMAKEIDKGLLGERAKELSCDGDTSDRRLLSEIGLSEKALKACKKFGFENTKDVLKFKDRNELRLVMKGVLNKTIDELLEGMRDYGFESWYDSIYKDSGNGEISGCDG